MKLLSHNNGNNLKHPMCQHCWTWVVQQCWLLHCTISNPLELICKDVGFPQLSKAHKLGECKGYSLCYWLLYCIDWLCFYRLHSQDFPELLRPCLLALWEITLCIYIPNISNYNCPDKFSLSSLCIICWWCSHWETTLTFNPWRHIIKRKRLWEWGLAADLIFLPLIKTLELLILSVFMSLDMKEF